MTPEITSELMAAAAPTLGAGTVLLLILLVIRDMVRKGIALWRSGTKKQLAWFICIFLFNTLGLLPIIYLAFFQKKEKKYNKNIL